MIWRTPKIRTISAAILFLLFHSSGLSVAFSQNSDFQFEHISLEQGVSNSLVWCMYQDRKGFLWYGTMYGLIKYNGYEFTTYRHDSEDSSSISNDDVISIYEDHNNFLWIGTFGGGLNKLDRTTGKFTRYLHQDENSNSLADNTVWTILEDKDGILWLGTDRGLEKLNPISNQFSHFNETGKRRNVVFALCEDRDGTLWVGENGGGLKKLNKENNSFTTFKHDSTNPTSISSNSVTSIRYDKSGALWIGTAGGGLNKFSSESGKFVHYVWESGNPKSLAANFVNRIIEDNSGNLWVATGGGLSRLDKSNQEFLNFYSDPADKNSLSSNNVSALLQDRSGILWVGTYNGGLDRLIIGKKKFAIIKNDPRNQKSLSSNEVRAIAEDRKHDLWIGTKDGLNKFNDEKNEFTRYAFVPGDKHSLSGRIVNAIAVDSSGIVWIGTRNGLSKREGGTFKQFLNNPSDSTSLTGNQVNALCVDRDGDFWIGTNAGLNKMDIRTGSFTRYNHDESDTATISGDYILSIYQDNTGAIYIGSYAGLSKFDKSTGRFSNYRNDPFNAQSLSNNYVLTMHQDNSGRMWLGTGGGLNLFDRASGTFTHFTEKDGLPNSVICGILEDKAGDLWLSTHKGLSHFEVDKKLFRNYARPDGLQSNMFLPGSALKRGNGEMLFGGIEGYNAFYPDRLPVNRFIPPVVVTSFMLFDDSKTFTGELSYTNQINLTYKENYFAFAFAALDFTRPEKNRYAFKLEGFDKDWNFSGRNRFARYTNMEPGTYVFRVKGTNNDGVWNEEGSSLKIVIAPPFWKTAWFRVLSGCFLLAGVFLVHRVRVREKVKQSLEMERVRRAEAERVRKKAAIDFHDELGHRLTKIGLFTEIVKRQLNNVSPEIMKYLDKIIEDSQNLTNDTRDFIWTLDPDKDSLFDVAIHLKEFGEELFDRTGVVFTTSGISEDLLSMKLSMETRRHLTLIFKEGMNNILKHAGCKNVNLAVELNGSNLRLSLTDDGQGYANTNGSGYGLKSMKQRAEKIPSRITFESLPGKGSRIELTTSSESL